MRSKSDIHFNKLMIEMCCAHQILHYNRLPAGCDIARQSVHVCSPAGSASRGNSLKNCIVSFSLSDRKNIPRAIADRCHDQHAKENTATESVAGT